MWVDQNNGAGPPTLFLSTIVDCEIECTPTFGMAQSLTRSRRRLRQRRQGQNTTKSDQLRKTSRILTLDDPWAACELLGELFNREGFAASFANSSEAALAEIAVQPPACVPAGRVTSPINYFFVAITSRYCDSTSVVPSVTLLLSLHSFSRSLRNPA